MTVVLVTGQIRDAQLTQDLADSLLALLREGTISKVIVSSWTTEKKRLNWFGELASDSRFLLLLEPELFDPGPSHFWAQSESLATGLRHVSNGERVIKLRTDVHLSLRALRELGTESNWCSLSGHREDGSSRREDSSFVSECDAVTAKLARFCSRKIWVPWADITKPLYIADEVFAASASVMRRLAVIPQDLPPDVNIDTCPSHIRRFLPAAIDYWSGFLAYARYFGESHHAQPVFEALQARRLRKAIYCVFLSRYYDFLLQNFEIGFDPPSLLDVLDPIRFRQWLPSPTPPLPEEYCLCRSDPTYSWGRNRTYVYDSRWLEAITNTSVDGSHAQGCQLSTARNTRLYVDPTELDRVSPLSAKWEKAWRALWQTGWWFRKHRHTLVGVLMSAGRRFFGKKSSNRFRIFWKWGPFSASGWPRKGAKSR